MNKGTLGFPQLYRDESLHGFPKKKVSGESFLGFPSGSEDYDLKAFISTSNTVKAIYLAGNDPKITIDWGDGIIYTVVPPTEGITYSHTYAQTGTFNVFSSRTNIESFLCMMKKPFDSRKVHPFGRY